MSHHDDRMQWPFFGEEHRRLATEAERWAKASMISGTSTPLHDPVGDHR